MSSGKTPAPARGYSTALSKDSPKSTVKIAQLDKLRESQVLGASGDSKSMSAELSSFKEEMKEMMKEMNKTITKNVSTNVSTTVNAKIDELESKFSVMFSEYKTDLQALRVEVNVAKDGLKDVSDRVTALEQSMDFSNGQQKEDDEKQTRNLNKLKAEIDTKMQELNDKLLLMEKHERKYNLLFYGFAEEKRGENVFNKMRKVFVDDLKLDSQRVDSMYFAHAHRLPAEREDGPRPLIMRFAAFEDKELVLSNAHKLAGSKRRILHDLPVVMKKERGRLAKEAYTIRHEEALQTRIKDRGLEVYLEVRKEAGDKWVKRKCIIYMNFIQLLKTTNIKTSNNP